MRRCVIVLLAGWQLTRLVSAYVDAPHWGAHDHRVLSGHEGGINAVVFSPDGGVLASASDDGAIKLWSVVAGKEVATLNGHSLAVLCLAFSPDGALLASGSCDGTIRVWNTATKAEWAKLIGHSDWVRCLAFSPDGSTLVSGSSDQSIRLWELRSTKERARWPSSPEGSIRRAPLDAASFSADGRVLAVSDSSGEVALWSVLTAQKQRTMRGDSGHIGGVTFADGCKFLASLSNRKVAIWEAATGKKAAVLDCGECTMSLAMSPSEKVLAIGLHDGKVQLWDVNTKERIASFEGHRSYVSAVAFAPDGKLLASANGGRRFSDQANRGEIRLWECARIRRD
jgi:WD40 repeat protein